MDTRSRGGILPLTAPWPAPGSAAANALRRLRTNVDYVDAQSPPRVIAVAGSSAREGATTTAVGLAFALARAGRSVILVDADLLRPGVGPFLGLDAGPGLTDVLAGSLDVDRAVRYPVDGGPGVLATGPTPPDAGPPPSAQRMRALFEKLSSAYDVVLIDTPPLVPVAEASELAAVVDGVLLCVRLRTREAELRLALDMLERVDARILGLAVTVPTTRRRGQRRSRIGRHGSERG